MKIQINVIDSNAKAILLAASVNALMALFFAASCDSNVCLFDSASCYKGEKLPPLVSMGASGDTPFFMLCAKRRASCSVRSSVATVWLLVTSATAERHSVVDECPQMNYQSLRSRLRNTDFFKILIKDEWNYSKGGKSVLNHLRKANDDLSKHPHVTNDYEWYCWCLTASTSRTCPIMLYFTSCLQLQHTPPCPIGNAVDMTEACSWRTFQLSLYFCFPMKPICY